MTYRLSEAEMLFLRMFCEIPHLIGFDDILSVDKEADMQGVLSELEKKGYIGKDESGDYYLPEDLTFMLMAAKDASRSVVIERDEKKLMAYFNGDTIILIEKDRDYELLWLPFLPYLIGDISIFMGPYVNKKTTDKNIYTAEQSEKIRNDLEASVYEHMSKVSFYENGTLCTDRAVDVYGNMKKQVLVVLNRGELIQFSPCKADLINSITTIIAEMHAESIKEGIAA